jgi:alpha-ribazole phosphatase
LSSMKLYIVRHGATIWNKEFRYQGQVDVSLSEEGYAQAELLSVRLAAEPVAAVYSSRLSRAYETAVAIARPHGLAVEALPGLREISFGDWEGHPYSYVREHYAESLRQWNCDPTNYCLPNGETLAGFRARVNSALDHIVDRHPSGTVVAVAHSGTIRMLFCLLLKMDLSAFWRIMQYNGSLNLIEFRQKTPTVLIVNDTSHLGEVR